MSEEDKQLIEWLDAEARGHEENGLKYVSKRWFAVKDRLIELLKDD